MSDRFKFRVYFKGSEYCEAGYQDLTRNDVIFSLSADGQIIRTVAYECQREGHEKEPCMLPFTPDNNLYDIQFCTGLKDKNGKLIYEGDILGGSYGNLYIHYCDSCKQFQLKANDYGCMACEGDINWYELVESEEQNELEVIGNIYENKELLNE